MVGDNSIQKKISAFDEAKDQLKVFDSDVIEYQFVEKKLNQRGLKIRAEWKHLGIDNMLYVVIEDMEKAGISEFWCDNRSGFSFPAKLIPSLIIELQSFYDKASHQNIEV